MLDKAIIAAKITIVYTYLVKANVKITAMENDINMIHKINKDQTTYNKNI